MIAFDTNVLVAALSGWHSLHVRSLAALNDLLENGTEFLVPDHALRETYSVLTRMPRPYRASPREAILILRALDPLGKPAEALVDTWALLERAAQLGAVSGQIHDAHLAHVAASAGAKTLLTWNVRHMRLVAPTGLDVREP
ncbi:MAG: PIN domain-containing protein [Bryobacteraceae bacterium]|nr:PIN domain-containing protein [Bryobacteraceae bacterium]